VGNFRLEEAVCSEAFNADRDVHPPERFLAGFPGLRYITLEDRFREQVLIGRPFQDAWTDESERGDGLFAVFGEDGVLLAILERKAGAVAYRTVFPEAQP
jgi:hypothetical protein